MYDLVNKLHLLPFLHIFSGHNLKLSIKVHSCIISHLKRKTSCHRTILSAPPQCEGHAV